MPQIERTTLIGVKPQLEYFLTIIGKQWNTRLILWNLWVLGKLFIDMTIWNPLNRHGISSVNDILMDWSRISKINFVQEAINSWKELISLKPMRQWCSVQRFDWCLFLKYYWVWSPRKATLTMHCSMQTSLRMRRSTLKYQKDLNSSPRMYVRNIWNWKIRYMVSVRVHVPSGNTWQIIWGKVVWSSQSFIPDFLLVRKSHVLYTLMILYFVLGTNTTSITWQCICKSWVLIWSKRMTLQGS